MLVGKFPFAASGKAAAIGDQTGFVKVVVDAKYGEVLGAHIIGHDATEMIAEVVTARALETTAHEVMEAMHRAAQEGRAIEITTRCARPAPLAAGLGTGEIALQEEAA